MQIAAVIDTHKQVLKFAREFIVFGMLFSVHTDNSQGLLWHAMYWREIHLALQAALPTQRQKRASRRP
jgi:hypothetical protein